MLVLDCWLHALQEKKVRTAKYHSKKFLRFQLPLSAELSIVVSVRLHKDDFHFEVVRLLTMHRLSTVLNGELYGFVNDITV